ncbi:MAG: tail fiber domain-containing protein [Planctomycetota bacterium]
MVDLRFRLLDQETAGLAIAPPFRCDGVQITDGLFSVDIDFGLIPLGRADLFLEISVTEPGSPESVLSPRQPLRPSPSAIQSTGAKIIDGGRTVLSRDDMQGIVAEQRDSDTTGFFESVYQTFTPDRTGKLAAITMFGQPPEGQSPSVEYALYKGFDLSGIGSLTSDEAFVSASSVRLNMVGSPEITLEAGQLYTIVFQGDLYGYNVKLGDPYPGGSSSVPTADFEFQVVSIVEGEPQVTVQSSSIEVNDGTSTGRLSPFSVSTQTGFFDSITAREEIQLGPFSGSPVFRGEPNEFTMSVGTRIGLSARQETFADPVEYLIGSQPLPKVPLSIVHIANSDQRFGSSVLNDEELIIEDRDAVVGLYSNATGIYGSAISLGEIVSEQLTSKWSIVRQTGTTGDLQFRVGPNANWNDGILAFEMRDTGDAWMPGQLFQNSSRENKEDITEIASAIDTLLKLRGVEYTWAESGRRDIGFIAEEMAEVLPEIVALDDNGAPTGIDYGRVTALLVEAVKMQNERLDRLESLVEDLVEDRK